MKDSIAVAVIEEPVDDAIGQEWQMLLAAPIEAPGSTGSDGFDGVVVGKLIGFADNGATPLVIFPGRVTSAAQPARATLDLHASHVGREVVVIFEEKDPSRPIVIGCLHAPAADAAMAQADGVDVEVDADGRRVVVTAKDQVILRCGKASITLTKEGKLLLQGTYISSHSSGAHRIVGGSVQIN